MLGYNFGRWHGAIKEGTRRLDVGGRFTRVESSRMGNINFRITDQSVEEVFGFSREG